MQVLASLLLACTRRLVFSRASQCFTSWKVSEGAGEQ